MCPFKPGDVVRFSKSCGSVDGVYWILNEDQYVSLELYALGEQTGTKGLYLSKGAHLLDWGNYEKICTIDQLRNVLLGVKL